MTGETRVRNALLKAQREFIYGSGHLEDAIFNYQYPTDETPRERETEYEYLLHVLDGLEETLQNKRDYLDRVKHAAGYGKID